MNNERYLLRTVLIFIVLSLVLVLTACKTEDVTKRAENEEKVLKAMIEYPGEGLYDPVVTVIGIGVDEPTEEELAVAEQRAAEEKQLWQDKVEDCFADGMFDTFYDKWYRTEVLGIAMNFGLTTSISQFGIQDDADQSADNIEHALVTVTATDEKGDIKSFDMDWMVIFDKDDPDLIQKIELKDDGGFYEAYTDSFDIGSGLTATEDETAGTRTIETDHFSLTLSNPDIWGYELDEYDRITIYSTRARNGEYGGRVLSVEGWNDPEEEPYDGMIPYKKIGVKDGHLIFVTYASDVQCDTNDEAAADEYMAIRDEAETIQEGGKSGPLILK